jgi:hypothetical protein
MVGTGSDDKIAHISGQKQVRFLYLEEECPLFVVSLGSSRQNHLQNKTPNRLISPYQTQGESKKNVKFVDVDHIEIQQDTFCVLSHPALVAELGA